MDEEEAANPEVTEEPHGDEGTDWKAMARKWEKQAKANKEKADAYDKLQEEAKSDLQKATERAEKAERELGEANAARELAELRSKVSAETGVPAELIQGADEESMSASAKALIAWAKPTAPRVNKPGSYSAAAGGKDARSKFAEALFG